MANDHQHPGPDAPFEPLYSPRRISGFERAFGAVIATAFLLGAMFVVGMTLVDKSGGRVQPDQGPLDQTSTPPWLLLLLLVSLVLFRWIWFLGGDGRIKLPISVYRAHGNIYVRILSSTPAAQTTGAFFLSCIAAAVAAAVIYSGSGGVSLLGMAIVLAIVLIITVGYYFDYRNEIAKGSYDLVIQTFTSKLSIPSRLGGPMLLTLKDVISLEHSIQVIDGESHTITLRVSVPPHGVVRECWLSTFDNRVDAEYFHGELQKLLAP